MIRSRAVYVCVNCKWLQVAKSLDESDEKVAIANANAHQEATGHQTVLQRPVMPWEVG